MLYAIFAVIVVIVDQWVKYYVSANIPLDTGAVTLIPGVCDLVNLHNNGVAFGFLSNLNPQVLLVVVTCVIVIAVIAALATNFISGKLGRFSAVMIAAGGVGNCIDRVINGYVQDMFKLTVKPLDNFAIFNVADIFITVFCILFIFYIIFGSENKKKADSEAFIDDDEEDEDERPVRRRKAPVEEEEPPRKQPVRNERSSYEQEYARYKAAKAQKSAPEAAPKRAEQQEDPFAEWERANANARRAVENEGRPVRSYAPAAPEKPAPAVAEPTVVARSPAPQPPKPAKADDELDLDAILAEFK